MWQFGLPGILLGLLTVFSISSLHADEESQEELSENELNELCADCHDEVVTQLWHTAHRSDTLSDGTAMSCLTCHRGNALAHTDDPLSEEIENPKEQSRARQEGTCSSCHQPHLQLDNIGFDPHMQEDIACADCHTIHTQAPSLLAAGTTQLCGQCHKSEIREFGLRSAHPLHDGKSTCLDCHDFTGRKQGQFGHAMDANCRDCHTQIAGPFAHEHMASREFTTEGSGCIGCHEPHGSRNDRLLVRTGDALCMQCHGTPPAHRTAHGGVGTAFDCMDCHSDIHGSFDNRFLLDPQLGAKLATTPASCFCHGVD